MSVNINIAKTIKESKILEAQNKLTTTDDEDTKAEIQKEIDKLNTFETNLSKAYDSVNKAVAESAIPLRDDQIFDIVSEISTIVSAHGLNRYSVKEIAKMIGLIERQNIVEEILNELRTEAEKVKP